MKRFQFTMQALLALTVLVALGCAAMINASPVWASGVFGVVVIVLAVTLLRALILGRRAVFSIGFATVGWLYFLFAMAFPGYYVRAQLPTDVALVHLAGQRYEVPVLSNGYHSYLGSSITLPLPEKEVNAQAFCTIAHGLITLALGFCGGLFCVYLGEPRNRRGKVGSP